MCSGRICRLAVLALLPVLAACGPQEARDDPGGAPAARFASLPTGGVALRSDSAAYAHPDLAGSPDGALCLVALAFDGRADEIVGAVLRDGRFGEPLRLAAGGRYGPPRVAADPEGGCFAVWSELEAGGGSVRGRSFGATTTGALESLSDEGGRADAPVVAAVGRDLWVAWESFRGGRFDVHARPRSGGRWQPVVRVTDHPRSDVLPTLAADAGGRPWIAWVSWRDGRYETGNYEVRVARWEGGGFGASDVVSRAEVVDLFPELVPVAGGLALVWTEARFPLREIEELRSVAYQRWTDKRYRVAWLEGDAFAVSREVPVASTEKFAPVPSDRATAVASPDGGRELWILHSLLVTRALMDRDWATRVARVDPAQTSAPVDLSMGATTRGDRLAAARVGSTVWLAETIVRESPAAAAAHRSWLRIQAISSLVLPPRRAVELEPARVPEEVPTGLMGDAPPRGEGRRVHHGDQVWRAYYGNLHSHSDFSRDRRGANGTVANAFRSMYDVAELDFASVTDHAEWLTPLDWWEIRKATERWNRPGEFVTFPAYEWTSFDYGHRNVLFPDAQQGGADALFGAMGATPDDLWRFLDDRQAIAVPHHPSHGLNEPVDWRFHDDRFQRLVEIFQNRGSYEFDGARYQRRDLRPPFVEGHSVRDALAAGHHLGIIASPDHGGGMGLAGVWASALTREAIFAALRERRTFGTTGAKLDLFLTVAGRPQGAEWVDDGTARTARGRVHGTVPGLVLTLVVDGVEVESWSFEGREAEIVWQDAEPLAAERYYYLRARQADGHQGWTSPVWIRPATQPSPAGGME